MSDSHFEILVNGVPRTWRDIEKNAIEAAGVLFYRDKAQSEIVVVDHRARRRCRITDPEAPPPWVNLPADVTR